MDYLDNTYDKIVDMMSKDDETFNNGMNEFHHYIDDLKSVFFVIDMSTEKHYDVTMMVNCIDAFVNEDISFSEMEHIVSSAAANEFDLYSCDLVNEKIEDLAKFIARALNYLESRV